MRRQISLKWLVTLSFLGLAVVVVVGYSLLSANFFIRGMDNIVADNMAKVVASYVESVPSAQRKRLNHFSGYQIGQDWSQMPEKVRSAFEMPVRNYVMFKHDDADWLSRPDEILFVMRVAHAGETYFISSSLTRDTASPLVGRNAKKSIRLLLVLSAATLATLAAVVWLLFKQVARPVNALGQWARELDENNLQETPPDFYYPELNDLAALIRNSLSSVQESLEREHRFLRHSSHELRTPISVIRNNVELLHKLEATSDKKRERREAQAIQRIDRASLTMKHLTETLLWLSRESEAAPPASRVRPGTADSRSGRRSALSAERQGRGDRRGNGASYRRRSRDPRPHRAGQPDQKRVSAHLAGRRSHRPKGRLRGDRQRRGGRSPGKPGPGLRTRSPIDRSVDPKAEMVLLRRVATGPAPHPSRHRESIKPKDTPLSHPRLTEN